MDNLTLTKEEREWLARRADRSFISHERAGKHPKEFVERLSFYWTQEGHDYRVLFTIWVRFLEERTMR